MVNFTLNHITAPRLHAVQFLDLAQALGCSGVEFRNDLGRPLFDGERPETIRAAAQARGLRIVGLSQVYPFNAWTDAVRREVITLIGLAKACGAETISLIPRNDGHGCAASERGVNLRHALREIAPLLQDAGLVALVEPLGFESSSLRSKAETVGAIEALGVADQFKIVHDTFHHHLAGGGDYFPAHTGIVHISGVVDPELAVNAMRDEHRVLVDEQDRLGNVAQIAALRAQGYAGPLSFEAFSPLIHQRDDIEIALRESMDFITTRL